MKRRDPFFPRGARLAISFASLAAALLTASPTLADEQDASNRDANVLADCHALEAPAERLACYDRVSGRATGPVAGPEAVAEEPTYGALQPAGELATTTPPDSLLDGPWGLLPDSDRYWFGLYRPNYLLFGRYSSDVNNEPFAPSFETVNGEPLGLDSVESKFQISIKARAWTTDDRRWSAWFAYTQQNQWQVYNEEISRPFRETNYEPELFATWRPDVEFGDWRWRTLSFGYTHESNGRSDPISRSWDRLFVEAGLERERFALTTRLWTRISESSDEDDNPDITDYLGYGEVTGFYRAGNHSFRLMVRGNPRTGKGAGELSWYSPPLLGPFRGYVQLFSGYGESLIDYNWNQTTIGAGIVLNDGL